MSTLAEWDRDIKPLLTNISIDASWVRHYVDSIVSRVNQLPRRPEWMTKAEDEIDEAIKTLERSLIRLRSAQQAYQEKELDK